MSIWPSIRVQICCIVCIFVSINSAQDLILTIRDTTISCDYLLVAPQQFQEEAMRLAHHRNNFTGDDVSNAKVMLLDSLYSQFSQAGKGTNQEKIWYGLHWAYNNWEAPFEYCVLVGDDSIAVDYEDTTATSVGRMPTFIRNVGYWSDVFCMTFSDDGYTTLASDTPTTNTSKLYTAPIALGRIPCETEEHLAAYVDKVIDFDLNAPQGIWRNSLFLCADDEFHRGEFDHLNHWESTESFDETCMQGYFTTKCYCSAFDKDGHGHHSNAKEYFFNHMAKNTPLWTIYAGHGSSAGLTAESFLNGQDASLFTNSTQPTVFFSFCCSNGSFQSPYQYSMCKQFLFSNQGGALLYFASPTPEFSSGSEIFGKRVFASLKEHPTVSFGKAVYQAKRTMKKSRFGHYDYTILGDPALILRKDNSNITIELHVEEQIDKTLSIVVSTQERCNGNYYSTFSRVNSVTIDNQGPIVHYTEDSTIYIDQGSYNSYFSIPIPNEVLHGPFKFTLYTWGEEYETRMDTTFDFQATGVMPKKSLSGNAVQVRVVQNQLVISATSYVSSTPTTIHLYSIRGQLLYTGTFPLQSESHSIDLKKMGLAAGHYRVVLKGESITKTLPFLYIK